MRRNLTILLAAIVAAPVLWAATATTSVALGGMPGGAVQLTIDGTSAAVEGVDTGNSASKRSAVVSCVVSGQAVVLLVRIERAPNGTFIDLVPSDTVGNLDTALGAMDLSATVPSHPSPTDDAVDAAAITDAGG